MTARTRAARAAAALVLAGVTVFGAAGCTFLTPTATLIQYDPSEGAGLNVGDIAIRNALLLPGEEGDTFSLVMTVTNRASDGAEVRLQFEGADGKTDGSIILDAGQTRSFGTAEGTDQLVLTGLDATEGSLFPIYVQTGDEPGKMLLVPVLNPNQPEYENLRPTSTPTPTPTPTVTPTPESTEAPEG